jgi:hypothetical protein
VRSLPLTDAVINTANPDIAKIHRLVKRALETAGNPSPSPSASKSGSGKSPADQGTAVDVNEVC